MNEIYGIVPPITTPFTTDPQSKITDPEMKVFENDLKANKILIISKGKKNHKIIKVD